jgi:hypothetical protein
MRVGVLSKANRMTAPVGDAVIVLPASWISPIGEIPAGQRSPNLFRFNIWYWRRDCSFNSRSMLKIQRTENDDVAFTVSGRLGADNISELSELLAAEPSGRNRILDLKDVVLVDGDVVRFLSTCEADGIVLRNCPPYIRAWITREGEQS